MSRNVWARREVNIAKGNNDNKDCYINACYDAALKAYDCLLGQGHSGMSIQITKNILNKLIDGQPLTPIEDTEDVWDSTIGAGRTRDYISKQCLRMSSLFKHIYKDGHVEYTDIDRVVCCYINDPHVTYTSGYIREIIDKQFPITMPYFPTGKFTVYCEDFLLNEESGDFDTVGIFYAIMPNGEKYEINKFIHYPKDGFGPVEIPKNVYDEYKRFAEKRENRK